MLNNKINEVEIMSRYVVIVSIGDAMEFGIYHGDLIKKKLFDLIVKQLKKEGKILPIYRNLTK